MSTIILYKRTLDNNWELSTILGCPTNNKEFIAGMVAIYYSWCEDNKKCTVDCDLDLSEFIRARYIPRELIRNTKDRLDSQEYGVWFQFGFYYNLYAFRSTNFIKGAEFAIKQLGMTIHDYFFMDPVDSDWNTYI